VVLLGNGLSISQPRADSRALCFGIFVSDNGGADQILAWKESGGFAGGYSPNAAYVQSLYNMTGRHTYVFKLKWKTNKNAPGVTIYRLRRQWHLVPGEVPNQPAG
jgi:hypothetical protein